MCPFMREDHLVCLSGTGNELLCTVCLLQQLLQGNLNNKNMEGREKNLTGVEACSLSLSLSGVYTVIGKLLSKTDKRITFGIKS